MFGQAGNDQLFGSAGDDVFYVESTADAVFENLNEGFDLVRSTITSGAYALPANVERLLLDSGNVTVFGNALDNIINGNANDNSLVGAAGNDTISGLGGGDFLYGGDGNDSVSGGEGADGLFGQAGNDTLTGGPGGDSFWFDTPLDAANNVDRILDFSTVDDMIVLENAVFTGLPNGMLSASAFRIGAAAADADDRIIYNSQNGGLFFDADGNGAGAAIRFATLAPGLGLTAADFLVV